MKSPPNNVAFIAETDAVSISKVGFTGEFLILFAQSKGISTCWYGHYKLSELERLMPHLQSTDQLKESNMGYGYSKVKPPAEEQYVSRPLAIMKTEDSVLWIELRKQPQVSNVKKLKSCLRILMIMTSYQMTYCMPWTWEESAIRCKLTNVEVCF